MGTSGPEQGTKTDPPRNALVWLGLLGLAQLLLWTSVAVLAREFTPGSDYSKRPLVAVVALMAAAYLLYVGSLVLAWNRSGKDDSSTALWLTLTFAVLFRLPLWWSQPIQEVDIYRYLWDGRVLAAGINPYRYSPEQVATARSAGTTIPELDRLVELLLGSAQVSTIFDRIEHQSVPTIYPPASEAVFAAAALLTPPRAPVMTQVRILKAVLLIFDLAIVGGVVGILWHLRQPPARVLAYAWCPLVLKEFANTGHVDSVAVCLTVAMLWLLTRPRGAVSEANPRRGRVPQACDWLAAVLWGGAVLAKLYPLVVAPVLLVHWWRRHRWRTGPLVGLAALVVVGGYSMMPRDAATARSQPAVLAGHSSFTGLNEFIRRWEMNDLLFSIVYENVRIRDGADGQHEPWYSLLPGAVRAGLGALLERAAHRLGMEKSASELAFLFTQLWAGGTLLGWAGWLAWRRWPEDPRPELLRRVFLILAWLWLLSATQNPWYWTWALPFVMFASRLWVLVSGFALIYYLRFWFIHAFPQPALPGGLTGQQFFDEVVVWVEHLPVLLALACSRLAGPLLSAKVGWCKGGATAGP